MAAKKSGGSKSCPPMKSAPKSAPKGAPMPKTGGFPFAVPGKKKGK